ncbi:MAG: hypothetical protein QOE72_4995, partial [Chloroflexota bacterium]|nr:hypothetical protein [Chloroflexota bacterium]
MTPSGDAAPERETESGLPLEPAYRAGL